MLAFVGLASHDARAATVYQSDARACSSVWVARRGWHIDVGLRVEELRGARRSVAKEFPGARYVFFGFGDRRYLTAKRHGSSTLAAALWPGEGLMLVTAIANPPSEAFGEEHVITLPVTARQQQELEEFVWATIASH